MDRGQIALKLFLDELGIDFDITTIDDRKRVQKAVYLGQLSGVDFGYRFGWYIRGPYSTSLTNDYFPLAESLASGDDDWEGKTLKKSVKAKLAGIKPLMDPPEGVDLPQEDWLELVASLDFLMRVSGYAYEEALKVLKRKKNHVFPYVAEAKQALLDTGLLPMTEQMDSFNVKRIADPVYGTIGLSELETQVINTRPSCGSGTSSNSV